MNDDEPAVYLDEQEVHTLNHLTSFTINTD